MIFHLLQPCEFLENVRDGSKMLCRMPVVNLPTELNQQLNESETGTIDNTHGPGVAVYWSDDGRTRADIYMGFIFDGHRHYENISSVDPNIKMQFSIPPDLFCTPEDVLDFTPNKDETISIEVIVDVNICSTVKCECERKLLRL